MIRLLGLATLFAAPAVLAAPVPSPSQFKHALRQPSGTGYCKNWCVAHSALGSQTAKKGCSPSIEGKIVPEGANPKKDKTAQHRKYCKQMCTPDICGVENVAPADDTSGDASNAINDDDSGGNDADNSDQTSGDDAQSSASHACSALSGKETCCATEGCGFSGISCMPVQRIIDNQAVDKCGGSDVAVTEASSSDIASEGLKCSGKAVRQMCKAAMQKELDCTTPTKLTAGLENCGSCTTEWADKSGCSAKCVLIAGTFGDAKVPQLCDDEASAKKEDGSPKHAALKELIGEWEMGHGGSEKAREAAAELGTNVDDSNTHLPDLSKRMEGLHLEPKENRDGEDSPSYDQVREDFSSLGGNTAKSDSGGTPSWGPDSRAVLMS